MITLRNDDQLTVVGLKASIEFWSKRTSNTNKARAARANEHLAECKEQLEALTNCNNKES